MENVLEQLASPKAVNGWISEPENISSDLITMLCQLVWDFEEDPIVNLMMFRIDSTIVVAPGKQVTGKLSIFHSGKRTISDIRDQAIWDVGFTQRRF